MKDKLINFLAFTILSLDIFFSLYFSYYMYIEHNSIILFIIISVLFSGTSIVLTLLLFVGSKYLNNFTINKTKLFLLVPVFSMFVLTVFMQPKLLQYKYESFDRSILKANNDRIPTSDLYLAFKEDMKNNDLDKFREHKKNYQDLYRLEDNKLLVLTVLLNSLDKNTLTYTSISKVFEDGFVSDTEYTELKNKILLINEPKTVALAALL